MTFKPGYSVVASGIANTTTLSTLSENQTDLQHNHFSFVSKENQASGFWTKWD